ncbi:MAG: hypothetical protein MHMPM18_001570 [Marteilia pararefringens]
MRIFGRIKSNLGDWWLRKNSAILATPVAMALESLHRHQGAKATPTKPEEQQEAAEAAAASTITKGGESTASLEEENARSCSSNSDSLHCDRSSNSMQLIAFCIAQFQELNNCFLVDHLEELSSSSQFTKCLIPKSIEDLKILFFHFLHIIDEKYGIYSTDHSILKMSLDDILFSKATICQFLKGLFTILDNYKAETIEIQLKKAFLDESEIQNNILTDFLKTFLNFVLDSTAVNNDSNSLSPEVQRNSIKISLLNCSDEHYNNLTESMSKFPLISLLNETQKGEADYLCDLKSPNLFMIASNSAPEDSSQNGKFILNRNYGELFGRVTDQHCDQARIHVRYLPNSYDIVMPLNSLTKSLETEGSINDDNVINEKTKQKTISLQYIEDMLKFNEMMNVEDYIIITKGEEVNHEYLELKGLLKDVEDLNFKDPRGTSFL